MNTDSKHTTQTPSSEKIRQSPYLLEITSEENDFLHVAIWMKYSIPRKSSIHKSHTTFSEYIMQYILWSMEIINVLYHVQVYILSIILKPI